MYAYKTGNVKLKAVINVDIVIRSRLLTTLGCNPTATQSESCAVKLVSNTIVLYVNCYCSLCVEQLSGDVIE